MLLSLLFAVTPPTVAVVDISAPDAIYEDTSNELLDGVVAALSKAGLDPHRVDRADVPAGCRVGPCLRDVAHGQKVDVLVIVDNDETDMKKHTVEVKIAALAGTNGAPLAVTRYVTKGAAPTKALKKFAAELARQVHVDAGVR